MNVKRDVETFLEDDPKLHLLVEEMEQEPQLPAVSSYKAKKNENSQQRIKRLTLQHHIFLALAILISILFLFTLFVTLFAQARLIFMAFLIGHLVIMALFWTAFLNVNHQLNQMDA